MKAPRRLVDENELFAELVDDAHRREPPPEVLKSLLDVLESPAASAIAPARVQVGLRPHGLWLAIAGAGVIALLSFIALERPHERPAATASSDVVTEPPARTPASAIAEPAAEAVPSIAIADLPDSKAARAPARPRAAKAASAPTSSGRPSMRREVELIARARAALTKGDAEACLATLALRDAEFHDGQFGPEAEVMRIEATQARGDRARARTLAHAFLAKSPDSAYAGRVRSLLAAMESK